MAPKPISEAVNGTATMATSDHERRKYVEASRRDYPPIRVPRSLVYGEYGDYLVFIPESRARFLAQVWRALLNSRTWGDLKRLAPATAYREIRKHNDHLELTQRRAHAPFDYYTMTGVPDGDYPDWPEQEMLRWMPRDIQQDFGSIGSSRINGDFLQLAPQDAKGIVQRLNRAGFRCRRNQRLIEQVHGERC